MPKLKLLFLIYDLERGGPELRLFDFVKHFPYNVRTHILVTSRNLSLLPQFQKKTKNVQIMPIKKGYLAFCKAWQIFAYIKTNEISIVNVFDFKDLFVAVYVKLLARNNIKIVYHSIELFNENQFFKKFFYRVLFRNVDAILSNSLAAKHSLTNHFFLRKKVAVIRNGIDVCFFSRRRFDLEALKARYLGIGEEQTVIGTVANFRKEKNYTFLLNAFKILSAKQKRLKLVCVGGGPGLKDAKDMCQQLGLADSVIFTGYLDEVAEYLALMDVFVLCSLSESFPNALLQAMSMELPVIVSNVGGCREIVAHMQNGIFFAPNNQNQFVNSVELLIDNRILGAKLGAYARKTVVTNFLFQNMISGYLKFFNSLQSG